MSTTAGWGLSSSCSPSTQATASPSCGREATGRQARTSSLCVYYLCATGKNKMVHFIPKKHLTSTDRGFSASDDVKSTLHCGYQGFLIWTFTDSDLFVKKIYAIAEYHL